MRSEAEEEKESDSFVFGGRCCLTSNSPAAALPLPFSLLQLCCLARCSVGCYVVSRFALVVIRVLLLVQCGHLSINALTNMAFFFSL